MAVPIEPDPRPASTVVLLRDSLAGPQVFMVQRHQGTAFMGGAHVFPGGRVEADDRALAESSWCDGLAAAAAALHELAPLDAVAFYVAAIREVFEEAGVLLARDHAGVPVSLTAPADQTRFEQYRADLHTGTVSLRGVIARERLRLALDALVPFAHWVTPPIDVRQFDTRFFATRIPPDQMPVHDGRETTHSAWTTPVAALEAAEHDRLILPPPTWTTLRELESFKTVDDALAWARSRRFTRRQPLVVERDGVRMLVLPGDPLHPDPAADTEPTEKRFVSINGRWRARRPAT